jgi:protein transport protein SEC31
LTTINQWHFDVAWCPRNPALIAGSSFDGNVSVYSVFGGVQQQVQTFNKIASSFPGMEQIDEPTAHQQTIHTVYHDMKKPAKWMRKPVGARFGVS